MYLQSALFSVLIVLEISSSAASFQNLGFDDGDVSNPVTVVNPVWSWGKPEDFLPGWQVSGDPPVGLVGLNATPPGYGFVTLFSGQTNGGLSIPVEGRFSFALAPFSDSPYVLTQIGDVPLNAKAIHFVSFDAHVQLRINSAELPLVYVPRSMEVNDVYGDISSFEGQTVELSFITMTTSRFRVAGLDSISFVIPEPSSGVLLVVGFAAFAAASRWRSLT